MSKRVARPVNVLRVGREKTVVGCPIVWKRMGVAALWTSDELKGHKYSPSPTDDISSSRSTRKYQDSKTLLDYILNLS